MRVPPPFDAHAHIAADIDNTELDALGAFVFAMTRSTSEYVSTHSRGDLRVIWGLGTHPGLVRAIRAFDASDFETEVESAALVGEIGLDGKSRVPMATQMQVLRSILEILQRKPRIASLHSVGAHLQLLRALHRTPVGGMILHWWTGSPALTEEAVRMGCYFSIPPAMMSSTEVLRRIPVDRLLPETDHPYGDRRTPGQRQPGQAREVESRLGTIHGLEPHEMRIRFWQNLHQLVQQVEVTDRFGPAWHEVWRGLA